MLSADGKFAATCYPFKIKEGAKGRGLKQIVGFSLGSVEHLRKYLTLLFAIAVHFICYKTIY